MMPDDPAFFHRSQSSDRTRPMWVTGFAFDPATRSLDFSGVPGFDLSRLQSIQHVRTGVVLYARPFERYFAYGLAEVDGVPVSPPPSVGKVLKVKTDCAGMAAGDELLCSYDPPTGG